LDHLDDWTVTQRLAPIGNLPDDFDERWDELERVLAERMGWVYPIEEGNRQGPIVVAFRVGGAASLGEAIVRAHATFDDVVATLEPFRDYMRVGLPDAKRAAPGRRRREVPMATAASHKRGGKRIELRLDATSEAARRANELARELVTARAYVRAGAKDFEWPIYVQTLNRVVNDSWSGFAPPPELVERIAYLVGAFCGVATTAVWTLARFLTLDLNPAEMPIEVPTEHLALALQVIHQALTQAPGFL
jgi:hypothetical protein